jgi:hypothetical protein
MRRAWMEEAEREIDEVETRPPIAVKLPADPGWRLVWMLVREHAPDVRPLHCELAIGIAPITFWGLEAPHVTPGVPGSTPEFTLGKPVMLSPLHGEHGHRLHLRARIFEIASPADLRSDDELVAACSEYLLKAEQLGT